MQYKGDQKEVSDIFTSIQMQHRIRLTYDWVRLRIQNCFTTDKSDWEDVIGAVDTIDDQVSAIQEVVKAKREVQSLQQPRRNTCKKVQKAETKWSKKSKGWKERRTRQQSSWKTHENVMKLKLL